MIDEVGGEQFVEDLKVSPALDFFRITAYDSLCGLGDVVVHGFSPVGWMAATADLRNQYRRSRDLAFRDIAMRSCGFGQRVAGGRGVVQYSASICRKDIRTRVFQGLAIADVLPRDGLHMAHAARGGSRHLFRRWRTGGIADMDQVALGA